MYINITNCVNAGIIKIVILMLCIFTIQGSFIRNNQELPCQNCLFIEMGSMACYTETCPDCGRVPPSRSKEIKKYRDNLEKVTFDKPCIYCFSLRFETILRQI